MGAPERLHILVVGRFYTEAFALHIAETLEAMGHAVVRHEAGIPLDASAGTLRKRLQQVRGRLDELAGNVPFLRERSTQRLLQDARSAPIDLTIVCHDFLLPREVRRLKDATGAPAVVWFPDAIVMFTRACFLNAAYDALFFKDPYVVETLRRTLDLPIHYLPECFNPAVYPEVEIDVEIEREYGCDLATAGNLYTYRAEFFRRLRDYDVRLWGNPPALWMDVEPIRSMIQGRYVGYGDKARALLAAKIVVNNLHPAEIWGLNARAFEIAGIGGFQMVDWRPGLGQLFEDGRELVSFRGMEELRERIDHYLPRPDERRAIAARGRDRARREHTFEVRLRTLVETALAGGAGHPMPEIRMETAG